MFVGHAALALLVKARRRRPSLVVLGAAAFGPDLVEWAFAAAGRHNRILSHSLIAVALGAVLAGLAYGRFARGSFGDAIAVAGLWASHWPADFLTGVKPTWPGGPDAGLNLYSVPLVDLVFETVLVLVAWAVYRRSLSANRRGRWLWLPLGLIAAQGVFVMALSGVNPLPRGFGLLHLSR
jgi:membrane-bound metal-dependent hydrolase YbcI (DUF457 family)